MKKVTKIVVNGQEYDGIDQMPSELRQQYLEMMGKLGGDADGDGVPDDLQRLGASNVFVKESITFNGKTYNSRDELPPDVRELLDHMPKPKPGEDKTSVEVKTTRVFEPRVSVSSSWMRGDRDINRIWLKNLI